MWRELDNTREVAKTLQELAGPWNWPVTDERRAYRAECLTLYRELGDTQGIAWGC